MIILKKLALFTLHLFPGQGMEGLRSNKDGLSGPGSVLDPQRDTALQMPTQEYMQNIHMR